jgi:hypothetical protein
VPGGIPLSSKAPSVPVTAYHGWSTTPTQHVIHECLLQTTRIITASSGNQKSSFWPAPVIDRSWAGFFPGSANFTLCSVGSLFVNRSHW